MNCKAIRVAITAAAILTTLASAQAADLARPTYKGPVYTAPAGTDWSGFYVGLNAGYAFGKSNYATTVSNPGTPVWFDAAETAALSANGAAGFNPKGFMGGLQFGYNWQWNRLVLGIEGDVDALLLKSEGSVTYADPTIGGNNSTLTQSVKTNWMATLRPRVGYAFDSFLPYVTGGVAGTQIKATTTYAESALAQNGSTSVSKFKIGWVAGVGFEYALWSRWSVKAEYLYEKFGSVTFDTNMALDGAVLANSVDLKAHIVRLGVNYHF